MQSIRIIEIPPVKAVYSGPLTTKEAFEGFVKWFSTYHAALQGELYPRDFMRYNERLQAREWFYALPGGADPAQVTEYPVVDLPAGLYAVAPCLNADLDGAADWERTREEILQWVAASERFAPYANGEGKAEKYPMFHIVSPGRLMAAGISVEDLYVPIVEKS